jgi:ribosomal protein L11 methyltransferase
MAYYEFTIRVPDTFRDTLIQRLSEAGCLGVIENDESLVAYFPEQLDIRDVKTDLSLIKALLEKAGRSHELSYECALIPEQDWNAAWKKDFRPVDAGERFTIIPPWEEKRPGRINLVIDPCMAFGTGHHETTRSCLALMEKYADPCAQGCFLDLGTGTGILAIAASKLGCHHVIGIDTDPLAVDAARKNIKINQTPDVEIRGANLSEVKGTFNVIAANLISGVLVELAGELSSHLNIGGIAILSGILSGQDDEVVEAMSGVGFRTIERYPDGKWTSLVVERSART